MADAKKSWADIEEEESRATAATLNVAVEKTEEKESQTTAAATVAAEDTEKKVDKLEGELKKIEELSISDDTSPDGPPLEDPDDTQIETVTGDTVYTSAARFEDLNLTEELIKGLYVDMGFSKPSKIQAVTLPMILKPPYKDLVAQAHNGSGKTTCFVLGMLSRVDPNKKIPQAICICPTRELAQQNQSVLQKMGKYTGVTSFLAIPMESSSYIPIVKCPPVTDQVVIGTPGTIKKWTSAKKLSTRDMKILVFDEADHMLAEDGFKDDSLRIMKEIQRSSGGCQVLLFSATFSDTVREFVSKVVRDGNQIFVKKEELTLDKVKQFKVLCPDELAKMQVIKGKIFEFGQKVGQTIIFVRTRESARMLHQELEKEGYKCTSIQGAQKQEDRDKIIKEFKDGLTTVLITTDLLARGFDQSMVNLVVNFDLPVKYGSAEPDYEVYLHRIGRAGRFGRKGAAFNLICTERDKTVMEKIERHFNHTVSQVPNWESEEDFEAALKDAGLV